MVQEGRKCDAKPMARIVKPDIPGYPKWVKSRGSYKTFWVYNLMARTSAFLESALRTSWLESAACAAPFGL